MEFPAGFTPVQGKYTVAQRDALFDRVSAYPDASAGTDGQVPVVRDGKIAWEPQSGGDGSSPGVTFSVTLTADGWADGAQTVSDASFAASGYSYIVSPQSGSYVAYASAQIYADDVTDAGSMTFHAIAPPGVELTAKILKLETVGAARTYNMVSGGLGGGGGDISLASIAITKQPVKTAYQVNERFDPAGMVVQANYSNGATLDVGGYTVSPQVMTIGTTMVTVTYTEGGVSRSTTQAVTVTKIAPAITVTPPTITLDADNPTATAAVTTDSDGAISVSSSDTMVATATVSNNTITVSSVDNTTGMVTLTVSTEETATYQAGSQTVELTAIFSRLPREYAELEYIQNVNGGYIATGVPVEEDSFAIEAKINYQAWGGYGSGGAYGRIFGGFDPNSENTCVTGAANTSVNRFYMATMNAPIINFSFGLNVDVDISASAINGEFICKQNGMVVGSGNYSAKPNVPNYGLFGTWYVSCKAKLGETKLWYLGSLVRDLVPAKRISDNEVGMYDVVEGKFYMSENNVKFVAGPAKEAS